MKRSPMKRSLPPPRKPAKVIEYQPRPRTPAQPVLVTDGKARMVVPIPKAQPLRSEEYRRLVASLPCVLCKIEGYSNACHSDDGSKGCGTKSSDATCYPGCVSRPGIVGCHERIGTLREIPRDQRRELEALWANQTRMKLREMAASDAAVRKIVERSIGL